AAVIVKPRSLAAAFGHSAVALLTLPFQALLMADAIIRTLYRLTFSKRRLLEWVSQAEVDRNSGERGAPSIVGRFGGMALAVATAAAAQLAGGTAVPVLGVILGALWLAAPLIVRWLDQPAVQSEPSFTAGEKAELHELAKDIWSFYEDYVTADD